MQLKTFRLIEGKLEFIGTREPKAGDCIIEGETSMSEVRLDLRESLDLKEATTSDFPLLFGKPAPPTQAELRRARQSLGKEKLANSYKAAHPQATEAEVNAFCQGRHPGPESSSLDDALRRAHPDWTEKQIEIFKRGR